MQNPPEYRNAAQILENNVLGAIFQDPTITRDVIAAAPLELFRYPFNRNLYRMIRNLDERGIAVTVENIILNHEKHLEKIGGVMYLMNIAKDEIPLAANVEIWVQKLAEHDARLKFKELMADYQARFDDPSAGSFEETLDAFEQQALQIRPKTVRENKNTDNLVAWYEDIAQKRANPMTAYGVLTGWEDLDRMTLGFQRSNLIVVGARTSMGKSAFAGEIEKRANGRGHKVASFSLEMSAGQKYTRYVSNRCNIPMQALRTGNITDHQLEKIASCMEELRRIHIDDTRGVTAEYITSEMRRLKRQEGLDLVIIDYLQEIVEPNEQSDNGGSAMKRVCQKLRKAAYDCDCAVIGLSQVKPEVDNRANKRPFVSDLYGGGGIQAVADDIILLYRDEYYDRASSEQGIIEVNLAKQRNGPTGVIKLKYDKDYQRIT